MIMSLALKSDEIFCAAEDIETQGIEFYSANAVKHAANSKIKELFESLAEMEKRHKKLFHGLAAKFAAKHGGEPELADSEFLEYLDAMVKGKVFKRDEIPSGASTEDIVETAIGFEKNSIVFFSAVKQLALDEEARKAIDRIICEEISHIAMLAGIGARR
jgi:rubrerythrin